jgi:uncharacterized protein YjeT (DUF2065 family)
MIGDLLTTPPTWREIVQDLIALVVEGMRRTGHG